MTGCDDELPRRGYGEPPLHGLFTEPGWRVGVQGHQRIYEGAEMVCISGKARRMAEDKPDVLRCPSQCREVGDVLGDEHTSVERGDGEQRRVVETAEFRELLHGHGVDPPLAEPLGSRRRVHLVKEEPHARGSGPEQGATLLPGSQFPVRGRGVGCDALVDLHLVRSPVAGGCLDLPG